MKRKKEFRGLESFRGLGQGKELWFWVWNWSGRENISRSKLGWSDVWIWGGRGLLTFGGYAGGLATGCLLERGVKAVDGKRNKEDGGFFWFTVKKISCELF